MKGTHNFANFPLHNMIYAPAKFAVATFNGLGGDAFTRNVTQGQIDGRRTDFGTKLIYPFLKTKTAIINRYDFN